MESFKALCELESYSGKEIKNNAVIIDNASQ